MIFAADRGNFRNVSDSRSLDAKTRNGDRHMRQLKRTIALLIVTVTLGSTFGGGCSLIPGWGKATQVEFNPISPVVEVAM